MWRDDEHQITVAVSHQRRLLFVTAANGDTFTVKRLFRGELVATFKDENKHTWKWRFAPKTAHVLVEGEAMTLEDDLRRLTIHRQNGELVLSKYVWKHCDSGDVFSFGQASKLPYEPIFDQFKEVADAKRNSVRNRRAQL